MNQTNNHSFEQEILHLLASMEFLSLIILFSTLSFVPSQSQDLADHYFINCGSNSDIYFTGETFIGDDKRTTFSRFGGRNAANNNPVSATTPEIYRTARVFTKKSWYELEAQVNNTFVIVRLHFSPFFSDGFELSNSEFDVSVSGFSMLSKFKVGNSTVIKELIIPIRSERKYRIEFIPSNGSTRAFVNAIEAFTAPSELFRHGFPTPHVSPVGGLGDMDNISSSYAFSPVYRINVGGNSTNVERDILRRNWRPDDEFIFNSEPAINVKFEGALHYNDPFSRRYDAPDDVYKTAKQLKNNSLVNITWNFEVSKNSRFLVRAHFCDIISKGLIRFYEPFNFFIYSQCYDCNYAAKPGDKVDTVQVPFYYDYVVDSDENGFVNVSIGARPGTTQPVFLNGLEIMELLMGSGVVVGPNGGKSGKKVYVVVGCVVGGVVIVMLIGFFIGLKYRKQVVGKKSESNVVPSYGRSSYTSISVDFTASNVSPIPNLNLNIRLEDIIQATNNFDESLLIGKGGFGKVYRGTFADGKTVAVKRGEKGHGQGRAEFVKEIMVLSKIRHRYLVDLVGYCDEKSEMILVYEFMEKGTLQEHLYNTKEGIEKLSWKQRLEICISATRGLDYLHTGSDAGIIHRDIKSANILLDSKYGAKVADFGISRLDNMEESEIAIKGSFGYFDPEVISCRKLTQKSDVYAFGVVLLEVLCARAPLDPKLPPNEGYLAEWAISQIKDGTVEKIIDPYIVDTIKPKSLEKFLGTVERCLKNTGDERPTMNEVYWDLEYVWKLQQMGADKEADDSNTMTASMQLSMSMTDSMSVKCNTDYSQVNDTSDFQVNDTSSLGENQVFSQLKSDEAR